MAKLVVEAGKSKGSAVELGEAPAVVGRLAACELPIEESQSSRKHFVVERKGAAFIVRDLGSKNGTFVNEVRVDGERELADGDRLRVGETVIVFESGAPRAEAAAPGAIGPFELEEVLARTPEGVVHRAHHRSLERKARVLFLAPDAAKDARARSAFLARARAAAAYDHPSLLAVYDAGEHEGKLYAITEDVEGEPLHVRIERAPPGLARSVEVLASVARGLAHVHSKGGVHGWVSPALIHVAEGGEAKLAFALTRGGRRIDAGAPDALERARYASPEEARGLDATAASDLFSLGAVAFRLAAGRPPYASRALSETIRELASSDPAPSPCAVNPDLPWEIEPIVGRLLSKDPAERPDAAAAAEELATLAKDLAQAKGARPAASPKKPPRKEAPAKEPEEEPAEDEPKEAARQPEQAPKRPKTDRSEATPEPPAPRPAAREDRPRFDPLRALLFAIFLFLLFVASAKAAKVLVRLVEL